MVTRGHMLKTIVTVACATAASLMLASCNSGSQAPPPPATLSITTSSLPNGIVGRAYPGFLLGATGGSGGYSWSWFASAGSKLPPGLSLQQLILTPPGQGYQGTIIGVPTTAGTYSVVVTVKDFESPPQHASAVYAITVVP